MARVTIVLMDNDDGSVSVVLTPNVAEIMNLREHAAGLTSAQAYAVSAALHIRDCAQEQRPASTRLILPPGLRDFRGLT